MLTFRLFYRPVHSQHRNYGKEWVVYSDDNSFPIELISLIAAQTIARDLSNLETFPSSYKDWYICDSKGQHYQI